MRKLATPQGLGDRLRTAAFAEYQAIQAFSWAAEHFKDVPEALRADWAAQVPEEVEHYEAIVQRMESLGFSLDERPVSDALYRSLMACKSGRTFCLYIASAEERGRQAGLLLIAALKERDPETAAIFQNIVEDEEAHVALAETYFGWKPGEAIQL